MKIALIIERSDVFLGGAERSVFELSSQLLAAGQDVTLLAAKGDQHARHVRVLCKDHPGKRTPLSIFSEACRRHCTETRYDIVHSVLPMDFADLYQPRGGAYPEALAQNAVSYDNSLITNLKLATSFLNFRRSELARAERDICKNPQGPVVAALSEYVARQFKQHYVLPDDRIAIIPNGVKTDRKPDLSEFQAIRHQVLDQYPLEGPNPVIMLFAANNFRLKGLAQLIKALALANTKSTRLRLHLFVAGTDHAAPYARLARSLNVDDKIAFLGGVTHIANALAVSDFAVLPTFYDPASRFILEALSMNKPVITSAYNGATDLFNPDRHGLVVDDPRNTEALALMLIHYADPANLKQAADAIAEDNIKERVSIASHVSRLLALYEKLLQNKK